MGFHSSMRLAEGPHCFGAYCPGPGELEVKSATINAESFSKLWTPVLYFLVHHRPKQGTSPSLLSKGLEAWVRDLKYEHVYDNSTVKRSGRHRYYHRR